MSRVGRGRHPDSIPQPRPIRDVAEAYDRHLAEVNRSALGPRDMSRVDAEVAVRLHLTGHSRVEIERAVRDRAPAHRPSEQRTWDPYARRAADHAFGPKADVSTWLEPIWRLCGPGGTYSLLLFLIIAVSTHDGPWQASTKYSAINHAATMRKQVLHNRKRRRSCAVRGAGRASQRLRVA
jgi:hypothetical protein